MLLQFCSHARISNPGIERSRSTLWLGITTPNEITATHAHKVFFRLHRASSTVIHVKRTVISVSSGTAFFKLFTHLHLPVDK